MKKIIAVLLILIMILPNVYAEDLSVPSIGERIAREAALWLGTPYGYDGGAEGYGSPVDCSGLVMRVYEAFGVSLPRTSMLQAEVGEKIPLNEMLAGDIVCFIYEDGSIGHVGIYVGGNTMIHSPRPGKTVEFSSYFEDWGSIKAVYGRRPELNSEYIPNQLPEETEAELSSLLAQPNTVRTDHLLPSEEADNILPPVFSQSPEASLKGKILKLQIGSPVMSVSGTDRLIDESGEVFPCIINDRTHLPLRSIAEEFGAEVTWINENGGLIFVKYKNTEITMQIGSDMISVNGEIKNMDSAPLIINGRTYLPIRHVAQELGWSILWDSANSIITLSAEN